VENDLPAGNRFFNAKLGGRAGGHKTWDGVRRKEGTGLKSFGGGAEGSPPTGASFLEKEEFSSVLGADKAGGDDFRVIEHKKVSGGKEGGEVTNRSIRHFSSCSVNVKEASRIAGMSGEGSNSIRWDGNRQEFLKGDGAHGGLTECAAWGTFYLCEKSSTG